MPRHQPPAVGQRRGRKVWLIAGIVAAVTGVVVVIFEFLVTLVANDLSHIGQAKPRKHLKPIPIAASACPYVRLMHTAANNFQIAQPRSALPSFNTVTCCRGPRHAPGSMLPSSRSRRR